MCIGVSYSVIRFRPNRIVGEFANIGIVSINVHNGDICYIIGQNVNEKINRFFPSCDKELMINAIKFFVEDLARLAEMSIDNKASNMILAFDNVVSVREGVVFFSDKRSAITEVDLNSYTEKLCNEYVNGR